MRTEIMLLNKHYQDINPLLCGYERCTADHEFGPASREYHLLHYVMSGSGVFRTPRGEQTVQRGQLFLIHPHEITLYRADAQEPWTYCWIGFESGITLPRALDHDVINAPHCEHIFAAFYGLGAVEKGREYYLCGKIYELLALLDADGSRPEHRGREYVLKAKNYMESGYLHDISVEKMARYLNLDRSYFCQLFKKYAGLSPQQYLVNFRLQKAAELIAVHGYRPGEAALSVGYREFTNFSRMFKRRFGIPPSAYQKISGGSALQDNTQKNLPR